MGSGSMEMKAGENPWAVSSLEKFQYYHCPGCVFQVQDKQGFVDHAFLLHPEAIEHLNKLENVPKVNTKPEEIKSEIDDFEDNFDIKEPASDPEDDFDEDADDPSYMPDIIADNDVEPFQIKEDVGDEYFDDETFQPVSGSNGRKRTSAAFKHKRPSLRKGFSCQIGHPSIFFQSVDELNEHVKAEHKKDDTDHICERCEMKFASTRVLDFHYDDEHEEQRFTCPICTKVFPNRKDRADHQKAAHAGDSKTLRKCPICEFRGKRLKRHWNEAHQDEELPVLCDKCDARFVTKRHLRNHVNAMHKSTQVISTCEVCGFQSSNIYSLKNHYKRVHTNIRDFQCEYCPKAFKSSRDLMRHQVLKHNVNFGEQETQAVLKHANQPPKVKPVEAKCPKCTMGDFHDEEDFNNHIIACYGGKPNPNVDFRCNRKGCEKSFHAAEVLHFHLYSFHNVGDSVCDICGSILRPPGHNLITHKENLHGKARFTCDQCGKAFTTKQSMERHVEVLHLGIKKHECEHCGKAFKNPSGLKQHVKVQHLKEPFQCKYCDFSSLSSTAFNKHRAKVHAPSKRPKLID